VYGIQILLLWDSINPSISNKISERTTWSKSAFPSHFAMTSFYYRWKLYALISTTERIYKKYSVWYDIWYDTTRHDTIHDKICYMIRWYDMIYDMMIWYDTIWYYIWYNIWYIYIYDMICDMMYDNLLTAIGLTPGGSSTVHIYTQTIHRTTQLTTLIGRLSGIQTQSGLIVKSAGRALSLRVIPWHLSYNRGKSTENPQSGCIPYSRNWVN
jgi:hypothetical protein